MFERVCMRAVLNGIVIANSDQTIVVEGNHYFPLEDVDLSYLSASDTHTLCPWKGVARYYHAHIEGETITNAAWYYPEPKKKADYIKYHIAFWPKYVME